MICEGIHKASVEAFIAQITKLKTKPSFEELAYRMHVSFGWEMSTLRNVFLAINRETDRQIYKYHSDNEKIAQAIIQHQNYLRSQLSK